MKIFIQIMATMFLFLVPTAGSQAFQNEPNGFRDLYWGESLQEIQKDYPDVSYHFYDPRNNSSTYDIHLSGQARYLSGYQIGGITDIPDMKHATAKYIPTIRKDSNAIFVTLWNNQLWEIVIEFYSDSDEVRQEKYTSIIKGLILRFGEYDFIDETDCIWNGNNAWIELHSYRRPGDKTFSIIIDNKRLGKQAMDDAATSGW